VRPRSIVGSRVVDSLLSDGYLQRLAFHSLLQRGRKPCLSPSQPPQGRQRPYQYGKRSGLLGSRPASLVPIVILDSPFLPLQYEEIFSNSSTGGGTFMRYLS